MSNDGLSASQHSSAVSSWATGNPGRTGDEGRRTEGRASAREGEGKWSRDRVAGAGKGKSGGRVRSLGGGEDWQVQEECRRFCDESVEPTRQRGIVGAGPCRRKNCGTTQAGTEAVPCLFKDGVDLNSVVWAAH